MRTHLVTPRGNLTTQLRELQEQVRKLKPGVGTGVRTAITTVGVVRSAAPSQRVMAAPVAGEARWA